MLLNNTIVDPATWTNKGEYKLLQNNIQLTALISKRKQKTEQVKYGMMQKHFKIKDNLVDY